MSVQIGGGGIPWKLVSLMDPGELFIFVFSSFFFSNFRVKVDDYQVLYTWSWKPLYFWMREKFCHCYYLGFPDSSVDKQSTCNAEDPGSISGWGRSTVEGIGYALQDSWASLVAQLVKNPLNFWMREKFCHCYYLHLLTTI